jgi:hypothetical protein
VRALPLAAGINVGGNYKWHFGPSGVHALPLAAGINVGGHYKWHFFSPLSLFLPGSLLILPEGVFEILHRLLSNKNIRIPTKKKFRDPPYTPHYAIFGRKRGVF